MKSYTQEDFEILKGVDTQDKRIAYVFNSKDGVITANFFWKENDVQTRGLIWDKELIKDSFYIAYPFLNHDGSGTLPEPEVILSTIIRRLNDIAGIKNTIKKTTKAERTTIIKDFEYGRNMGELKALSAYSLEHPLNDEQFQRMMFLKEKVMEVK